MGAIRLADEGDQIVISTESSVLARYVYRPRMPATESPRPYLDARTLAGNRVSAVRPPDHRWHHGLSLALPFVGDENLWGGPTWVREERAYRQLDNNGTMRHDAFADTDAGSINEFLTWTDARSGVIATEERRLEFSVNEDDWELRWSSRIVNRLDHAFALGSPATHGRTDAGYGGLFFRAPRSFTGGRVYSESNPGGSSGEELMGSSSRWLGYVGGNDGIDGFSTVLMVDDSAGGPQSTPWFARSIEYPGFGPAPFFHRETVLAPGDDLDLCYRIVIADRARSAAWMGARISSTR